ncbi:MAG: enoyl-CoA hydratase/isomerase family protein [Deltaproteobacteria bacterium]|nr:enoyl-CoA hydratase/isomerase family protein [Deltaproteobacteria bacterium]
MGFENLLVEDRGALRVITVNRPQALNALSRKVVDELGRAFEEADANPALRALALTGAGEKAFVAGADITEFSSLTPEEARAYSAKGHAVLDRLTTLRMPVVAAVNGFALGGGLELALACDFIWASDSAKLGLVETNLGIIPGFGGVARLSRRVGKALAAEMICSAAQLKADEALRVGLVNRVLPQAELLGEVGKLADTMAGKGPLALAAVKRLLREGEGADLRTANAMEQAAFGLVFSTADAREGVAAFTEKRKASFQGR